MDNPSIKDDNDFSKQRRNLMLVSGLILLRDYLDINYSDANIFGITAGNIEGLTIVIWILWIYFFIRFFNLFFEKKNTFKTPVIKKYTAYLNLYTNTYINKNADEDFPPDHRHVDVDYKPCGKFDPHFNTFNYENNIIGQHLTIKDFELKKYDLYKYYLKALLHYIFKTHYFTEYYFPIIFGLLPLWTLLK